jgi:hypothetical protein
VLTPSGGWRSVRRVRCSIRIASCWLLPAEESVFPRLVVIRVPLVKAAPGQHSDMNMKLNGFTRNAGSEEMTNQNRAVFCVGKCGLQS